MNLKTEFTEPECDWFRRQCNFTYEERAIFDLRVKGYSTIEIEHKLRDKNIYISGATIERRLKSIKNKIYKVI